MVAGAFDHYIFDFWHTHFYNQQFSFGSLYLYLILMNREKAFETIIVLALASLIASLWLNVGWLVYVAITFLGIGIVSKSASMAIAKVWLGFSHYLGMVMNFVLMFIIFHLILIPLALLQRLFGGNQIRRKTNGTTYFHLRNHRYSSKDIDNPW